MAGIGFSLKRLFRKRGFFALCRAYGYAGIICVGPMLLGVILLVGMSLVSRIAGMGAHDRELLNCMLTYSLLASLTVTSWFNMVTTRYVSDMLYEEKPERIMPSFYGSCSIMLVLGGVAYGIFLLFSGVRWEYQLLCLWFSLILIVVWMEMVYLTALKDYKAIVLSFAISLMVGFLVALILVILGWVSVISLMLCVILSYGMLMAWYYKLMLDYFPKNSGSKYAFLQWFRRYRSLAFSGGFLNIGLFSHLIIMYFGPLRVQVEGLFYGAPMHDVPALFAFFSLLITTINFVTSVEVRFYPKYRNYYSLFNDGGSIRDIEQAEEEMLSVLEQELSFGAHKQVISTVAFVIFGSYLLDWMPVGLTDVSIGIYRLLCAGYGVYAISNSMMLILLYYEDYAGALLGTAAFGAVSTGATIWQILYGSPAFYGLGFLAGGVVFYIIVWLRLEWYTKRLPYFLLCRQTARVLLIFLLAVPVVGSLTACGNGKAGLEQVQGASDSGGEIEDTDENLKARQVEKEVLEEEHLREDKSIYEDDEELSVVTMYLTVRSGNQEDNTDHTWAEINSYSAYDYEDMGVPRYNCEAILQVGDENGPLEGEFGFGETTPNAAVQIRGQTSSRLPQKNYKIRIKKGKGEWREQRTIALNKHASEPYRFRNKMAYDLMKEIPQMAAARTQFVHLYVKDETAGGSGQFEDYGLYTQVEQINRTYLKNHGLDSRGNLYKINFFEWYPYEDALKQNTDEDYDPKVFEQYLEIKGNEDHRKLLRMLEEVNDYSIPIEQVVEKYFDVENICYWMAFQTLIGNNDVGARNGYLYSPLNSEKWYLISWDNDSGFARQDHEFMGWSEGGSWERGLTNFVNCVLFRRMFKVKEYREALDEAVADLLEHYVNEERVEKMAKQYAALVKPYLFRLPDSAFEELDEAHFDSMTAALGAEINLNCQYYLESLEKPWPFYIGVLERAEDGTFRLDWDASYDVQELSISYTVEVASDFFFQDIVFQAENIRVPSILLPSLPPGRYYVRVRAVNEAGFVQEAFDYYAASGSSGKIYGTKCFDILEDGTVEEIWDE